MTISEGTAVYSAVLHSSLHSTSKGKNWAYPLPPLPCKVQLNCCLSYFCRKQQTFQLRMFCSQFCPQLWQQLLFFSLHALPSLVMKQGLGYWWTGCRHFVVEKGCHSIKSVSGKNVPSTLNYKFCIDFFNVVHLKLLSLTGRLWTSVS